LTAWLFPQVLKTINASLSGEKLAHLTADEAEGLYKPLLQFHAEVNTVLENASKWPWVVRKLAASWVRRVEHECEDLGDILEALAWGCDPELRNFIRDSIADVETPCR